MEDCIAYKQKDNKQGVIIDYNCFYYNPDKVSEQVKEHNTIMLAKALSKIESEKLSNYITFKIVIDFNDFEERIENLCNRIDNDPEDVKYNYITIYPKKMYDGNLDFTIKEVMQILLSDIANNNMVFDINNMSIEVMFLPSINSDKCENKWFYGNVYSIYIDEEEPEGVKVNKDGVYGVELYEQVQNYFTLIEGVYPDFDVSINEVDFKLRYSDILRDNINAIQNEKPCMSYMGFDIPNVLETIAIKNGLDLNNVVFMAMHINGLEFNTSNAGNHKIDIGKCFNFFESTIAYHYHVEEKVTRDLLRGKYCSGYNYGFIMFNNGIIWFKIHYNDIFFRNVGTISKLDLLIPREDQIIENYESFPKDGNEVGASK